MSKTTTDVSIILPVYNAESWLDDCLQSVYQQTFTGSIQLSIYNDASTDDSELILKKWREKLESRNIQVIIGGHGSSKPRGVGYAKNRAIEQSTGEFLCFLDSDDVMTEQRIEAQFAAASSRRNALIGSCFYRVPEGSTQRYTNWANNLKPDQLYTQMYTSHGPTVIMPTWFCSRAVYVRVGSFDETGQGTPEDLLFFYKHLRAGGELHRVDERLLMYRYHPQATTFSIKEESIWQIRMREIQEQVLIEWPSFTIWNAGKQGRQFYRSLSLLNQRKVTMFCDVDDKKIKKGCYIYEESTEIPRPRIPIVHFTESRPPYIICVKQDLTGGGFEKNLASLNLREGIDFFHFN